MKKLLPFLLVAGCASTPSVNPGDRLDDLAAALTGTFSSAAQAEADPDNFFDIRLVMLPIWEERGDGPWLYVEQALGTMLERPYRQRVYHLVALPDGRLRSDVYTLPGAALDYAGAWREVERFDAITPADLELREGCSITLECTSPGFYRGATMGDDCASNLGDAAYATSEVTLAPGLVTSWDRGWTAQGEQAWGAEKGPYRFELVE